jgi:hypothetical protein
MTNADRILHTLKRHPEGLDDDELSQLSGVTPRQQVNMICRKLEADGIVLRERDYTRGKTVNRLTGQEAGGTARAKPFERPQGGTKGSLLSEDDVKRAVRDHLRQHGWTVSEPAWGQKTGIDIQAVMQNRVLVVEAKGEVQSDQQMGNYFLGALGELIQRMDSPDKEYALAFPEHRRYVNMVARLPLWVKRHLRLQFFFVRREDSGFIVSHETH